MSGSAKKTTQLLNLKKATSLLKIGAAKPEVRVKLISTDFDGTLVGSDNSAALEEFFAILVEQRKINGVKWIINTGRDWESLQVEMQSRHFPVLPDWVALSEREVFKIHREHPVGDYEWNRACEEIHQLLFSRTKNFWKQLEDFVLSQTGGEISSDQFSPVSIRARNEHEATRIHQYVNDELRRYPGMIVMRNSVYFRFSHEHYHKGSCLQRIQRTTGLTPAQTMAVGDHYNDLPMLHGNYARHLSCPSNSIPEVKERVSSQGGYVAKVQDVAGVVEAWKSLLA